MSNIAEEIKAIDNMIIHINNAQDSIKKITVDWIQVQVRGMYEVKPKITIEYE